MSSFSDRGLAFIDLMVNGALLLLALGLVILIVSGASMAFNEVRHWLQVRKIENGANREAAELDRMRGGDA